MDSGQSARLTGLARHLFDCTGRLNRAHQKLQAEVSAARAEGVPDEQIMRAIDSAADTQERRLALRQVERVLRKPEPETEVERIAREYATGKRPVR